MVVKHIDILFLVLFYYLSIFISILSTFLSIYIIMIQIVRKGKDGKKHRINIPDWDERLYLKDIFGHGGDGISVGENISQISGSIDQITQHWEDISQAWETINNL